MNDKMIKMALVLVAALFALFFLNKILRRTGLFKGRRGKARDKKRENLKEMREIPYFSPEYKNTITGYKELPEQIAIDNARTVRKSVRGFGTREENLYSVFQNLFNKVNISQISQQYFKIYKRDMKADILKDLKDKEKSILMDIINTLPDRN